MHTLKPDVDSVFLMNAKDSLQAREIWVKLYFLILLELSAGYRLVQLAEKQAHTSRERSMSFSHDGARVAWFGLHWSLPYLAEAFEGYHFGVNQLFPAPACAARE